jgi:hypothetical protein
VLPDLLSYVSLSSDVGLTSHHHPHTQRSKAKLRYHFGDVKWPEEEDGFGGVAAEEREEVAGNFWVFPKLIQPISFNLTV